MASSVGAAADTATHSPRLNKPRNQRNANAENGPVECTLETIRARLGFGKSFGCGAFAIDLDGGPQSPTQKRESH
jgi:hypothetical protein